MSEAPRPDPGSLGVESILAQTDVASFHIEIAEAGWDLPAAITALSRLPTQHLQIDGRGARGLGPKEGEQGAALSQWIGTLTQKLGTLVTVRTREDIALIKLSPARERWGDVLAAASTALQQAEIPVVGAHTYDDEVGLVVESWRSGAARETLSQCFGTAG